MTNDEIVDKIRESSLGWAYADVTMNRYGDSKEVQDKIYSRYKDLAKTVQKMIIQARLEELSRIHWKGEPITMVDEGIAIRNRVKKLKEELKGVE